MSFSTI